MTTGTKSIKQRLKKLGFNSYSAYLRGEHWQELRKRFYRRRFELRRKKGKDYLVCEFCNKQGKLNLHHKTYKRLGKENLGDFFLLCDNCHLGVHTLNKFGPKRMRSLWKASHQYRKRKWQQYVSNYLLSIQQK